jgi:hypothetical protein
MGKAYTATALTGLLKKHTGALCLSVVIPFGRSDSADTKKLKIGQATNQAIGFLRQHHHPALHSSETVLAEIGEEVHYDRECSGIGIFTAKGVQEVFCFTFPVKEKFVLADKFDLSDLLLHAQYERAGYILQLTRKKASLFLSGLANINEVRDERFPLAYSDTYEYARPAHASSNKGHAVVEQFEHDKSHQQQIRHEQFTRAVDHHLGKYLFQSVPFVITGESKLLNAFEKHTAYLSHLVGIFPGNFSKVPLPEFHTLTRHFFQQPVDHRISQSIQELGERMGTGLSAEGISSCWTAAREGKGLLLLVEKDYRTVGFLLPGSENQLHLHPPAAKHRIVTNAVNELVHVVLEKKGEVLVVDNGLLRDHQRIGLIRRYL